MSDTKTETPAKTTTTAKSKSMGALWKKSGQKADGTPWSFLSGNVEINGQKIYITVNKSKISDDERKASRAADYLIYKDDYIPKSKVDGANKEEKTEEEPF